MIPSRLVIHLKRKSISFRYPNLFGFFKLVPSVLLVYSFLPLVVFFAQFYLSSAIEQKDKTEQKTRLRVKMSTPGKPRAPA
jgi:hypothetical protein